MCVASPGCHRRNRAPGEAYYPVWNRLRVGYEPSPIPINTHVHNPHIPHQLSASVLPRSDAFLNAICLAHPDFIFPFSIAHPQAFLLVSGYVNSVELPAFLRAVLSTEYIYEIEAS
jgi:hypothetical protein